MWGKTVWLCLMRCVRVTGANLPGQGIPAFFQNKQDFGRLSTTSAG
jgi:hypothetical protein